MGEFLNDILKKLLNNSNKLSHSDIAITWINYRKVNNSVKGFGCGINNKLQIYPASIVKLVYALAIYSYVQNDKLNINLPCFIHS